MKDKKIEKLFNKASGTDISAVYILSFLIPLLLSFAVLAAQNIYPFGDMCFLKTDMYHQYAPFFAEFRRKLVSGDSMLYSWNVGMGINFISLMAYYLAGIGNLFIALVPESMVIEFMTVIVLLKIGFSGISMTYYLEKHFNTNDEGIVFFSLFYALSGYVCAYYWNLMWLDCIVMFPLVMYGIEKLVRGEGGAFYGITLAVTIITNYYIAMMTCIASVIYFGVCNILNGPESAKCFLRRCLSFSFWSIIAGGCGAILILPAYFTLKMSAAGTSIFPKSFTEYFSVIDMLARHLPAVETEQGLDHWPNIYCGTGAILFIVLYLRSNRVELKEKAVYCCLCIFFLSSFSVNVLNFIWHGFHYPNSLPARQSYIYIFLVLTMAFRAYLDRGSYDKKEIGTALAVSIIFILFCQKFTDTDHFHMLTYYGAMVLTGVFALLLYMNIKTDSSAFLWHIALFFVVAELAVNTAYTSMTVTSRTSYTADNEDIKELVDSLDDHGFFRIQRVREKTKNDGAWLGFRTVPLFSSCASADVTRFFTKMGSEGSVNAYSLNGSTPLLDMLTNVKYGIYQTETEKGGRKYLMELGDTFIYKNDCVLPLGFVLPDELNDDWMFDMDDPANVQNSICDALKVSEVLVPAAEKGNANGQDYAVTVASDGDYYAYVNNSNIKSVDVVCHEQKRSFDHLDRHYFIDLPEMKRGDLVKMKAKDTDSKIDVELYRFDYDALNKIYDRLSREPFEITDFSSGKVSGNVTVFAKASSDIPGDGLIRADRLNDDKRVLYFSVPYDESWNILVDGEKAEPVKVFGAFLGIELSEGRHSIELSFIPKGFKAGALISVLCLLILAGGCVISFRKKKAGDIFKNETEKPEGSDDPVKSWELADESCDSSTKNTDEEVFSDWMSDDGLDSDVVEYTKEDILRLEKEEKERREASERDIFGAAFDHIEPYINTDKEHYPEDPDEWISFGGDDGLD